MTVDSRPRAHGELASSRRRKRLRCGFRVSGSGARRALLVGGLRIVFILGALGCWQLASGRLFPDYIISNPVDVASHFRAFITSSVGWHDISVTMQEAFLGYILGIAGGVVVGLLLATFRLLGAVLEPMVVAANGVPHIVFAPLFLVFFGLGIEAKVTQAFIGVFFLMFYNTYIGIRSVRQDLVNTIRLFGASRREVLRYAILPGMALSLFTGLRAGMPFAIVGAIVGEFIASSAGIGYFILESGNLFESADVFTGIAVLACISLILNQVFRMAERRLFAWTET